MLEIGKQKVIKRIELVWHVTSIKISSTLLDELNARNGCIAPSRLLCYLKPAWKRVKVSALFLTSWSPAASIRRSQKNPRSLPKGFLWLLFFYLKITIQIKIWRHWQHQTRWYGWIHQCQPESVRITCDFLQQALIASVADEHDIRAPFTSIEGISMTTDTRLRGNAPRTLPYTGASHAPVAANNTNCIAFCHCTDVDGMTRRASSQLTALSLRELL